MLLVLLIFILAILSIYLFRHREKGAQSDIPSGERIIASLEVPRPSTVVGKFYPSFSPSDNKFYPPDGIISKVPRNIFVPGSEIVLRREPQNTYDSGAIALYLSGHKIGYMLRNGLQEMVHEWICKNWPVECVFVSLKKIRGKYEGYISLTFYRPVEGIPAEHRRLSYGDIDIKSITPTDPKSIPATPLTGKKVVFCGYFDLPLQDMMQKAVDSGAILRKVVTKTVDYLVVGNNNEAFLDENGFSGKEVTANKLNDQGANIRIISSETFLELTQITL